MTGPTEMRGAAPVGYLHELPTEDVRAIRLLRQWCGPVHEDVTPQLIEDLGPEKAQLAAETLGQIATVMARYARRPLMRHSTSCDCVGGDEACFATLVSAASHGAREDAMMIACLMVRADFSPALVGLAEQLGLALRAGRPRRTAETAPMHVVH